MPEEGDLPGRQVCDELQLVLDDLGWGESPNVPVALTRLPVAPGKTRDG
jgi:hypothetical protein